MVPPPKRGDIVSAPSECPNRARVEAAGTLAVAGRFRHPAGMRFVHASDWHLGRLFHGEHLTGDQAHVLEQLVTLVGESKADALIVAGDLYDRAVPPSEAVELLDETLSRLAMDVRVPVVLIAGNHDSPERVGFASRLLERSGVHVFGPVQGKPGSVVLEDEHGSVVVHAIPYTDPPQARHALGDEDIKDHDAAVRGLVASARDHAPPGPRSICVAHAFVVGGEPSESERPLSVGGSGVVAADCFTEYSYAALGHLHRPQTAGAPHVRYSGSLLKYSFSEADHAKSVSLVELDAKGQANVEEITLSPKHDVRVVTGMLADLLEGPAEGKSREDYLLVRLENREALLDVMGKLREVYPNVMHVERTAHERPEGESGARVDHRKQGDAELFEAFVREVTGDDPSEDERAAFLEIAEQRARAEREA